MGKLAELQEERYELLRKADALANTAMVETRSFTADEQTEVDTILKSAGLKGKEIETLGGMIQTQNEVSAFLRGDAPASKSEQFGGGPRKQSPLAKSITRSLFGGSGDGGRTFMDADGYDHSAKSTPVTTSSGIAKVSIARRQADGGFLSVLPESGSKIMPLLQIREISDVDYKFYRQTTRDDLAAEFVAPKGQKPTAEFGYEVVKDRARTVAVLSEPIPRQDLADIAGLKQDLGDELARRVIRRIDNNILNGDTDTDAESFEGILSTSGVRQIAYGDSAFNTVRTAITTLETAAIEPTAIVLNPTAWQAIELTTDSNGRPLLTGLYTNPAQPMLFGKPVVLSDLLDADTAIVADFRGGGLQVRQDMEVSWSDGGDLFETNTVRFRAEARVGLNVTVPSAFAVATLSAGSGE